MLGDKPLIAWTIEEARKTSQLNHFLVSTDDDEVAEISRKYGAPVPFKRPATISEDVDTVFVAQHSVEWFEHQENKRVSHVCLLQPTSPFRNANDIDSCIQIAKRTNADSVISVAKARQHPFWAFEIDAGTQKLHPFMDIPLEGDVLISQNLPLVLYPNGAVYVTKRDVIMDGRIFGNSIYGFMMPSERSVDLEDELDFIVCSALLPVVAKHEPLTKLSWIVS